MLQSINKSLKFSHKCLYLKVKKDDELIFFTKKIFWSFFKEFDFFSISLGLSYFSNRLIYGCLSKGLGALIPKMYKMLVFDLLEALNQ